MKLIFATIRYLLIGGVVLLTLLLLGTLMPIQGGIKVKIVKSGSMEPTIMTGSIVIIKPEPAYSIGDIITFGKDTKTQIPTTHRIVAVSGSGASSEFQTKGDANDAPDPVATRMSDISGKVIFHASYIGYILDFARKPLGFALIVGVPAFAIILDEVMKIVAEVRRMRREKRKAAPVVRTEEIAPPPPPPTPRRNVSSDGIMKMQPPVREPEHFLKTEPKESHIYVKSFTAMLFIVGSLAGISSIGGTKAYFNDVEVSIGNLLKAGLVSLVISTDNDTLGRAAFVQTLDASSSNETNNGETPPKEEYAIGSDLFSIDINKGDQSFPLQYTITPKLDDDAPNGCKEMTLEAWIGDFHWSGLLTDFNLPATTTLGHLQFLLTIPVPNTLAPNAECGGALIFKAGIAGAPDPLKHVFSDTKEYRFEILNSETTPSEEETTEADQESGNPTEPSASSNEAENASTSPVGGEEAPAAEAIDGSVEAQIEE